MKIRTGDRQLIKELNIGLVINLIRQVGPISRVDIADSTGLGRSTVTGIMNTLIKHGLVSEIGSANSTSGRKPVLLTFNAGALYAVGIKLAPASATVALVDSNATVVHTEHVSLNPGRGVALTISAIKQALDTTVAVTGVDREKILGVGVVMPGVVDPATGVAVTSYFLAVEQFPVRDILEQELDLPVYVDNDANGMALAEALYGAGRGAQDLLGVTVGVGIGAGIIIGGRIHRGSRFSAGELGHVCVVPDGPPCVCGRRGCLEAVASDAAIVRRAREQVTVGKSELLRSLAHGQVDLITRELVVSAAKAGDEGAVSALTEAGRWLGLAVGNAVNLLSPARIVVGGEAVLEAGNLLLDPMRKVLDEVVFPAMTEDLAVVPASLGSAAWVQGAAALVLSDVFQVPIHEHNTIAMGRRVGQNLD